MAAKRVKKRSRQSEPAPKIRRSPRPCVSDEYDEDAGRIESQTFLALVEFEAKKKLKSCEEKKGYMEKFGKGVGEAQAKLKMAMGDGQQMLYVPSPLPEKDGDSKHLDDNDGLLILFG